MREPGDLTTMSFEDAARLDPERYPGELVGGRFQPVTRNTWKHGQILINVGTALKLYSRAHPGWVVAGGDPGAKLSHGPDVLRGPDVGVIRAGRLPSGRGAQGWLEGAPDLAVEVQGDTQSFAELVAKALEYLAAGSQLVWVVDPHAEKVVAFAVGAPPRVLGRGDTLDAGSVLPEFRVWVDELFD